MSSKAVLRLLIGCALAALLLIFLLPAIGIPKSYLLPPPTVLQNATGKATAYVHKKSLGASPNPFKSGDTMHYIDYQFRATVPKTLLDKPTAEEEKKKRVYTGEANVPENMYDSLKEGDTIPVRFETTRPDISAIDKPSTDPNSHGGASIVGSWILFIGGILFLGYLIAPFLQRIILREDY